MSMDNQKREMKHTFDNFVAIARRKSSFRIMRNDTQNVGCAKHRMSGNKESDDSVINTAVKVRELSTSNNVVAVNDFFHSWVEQRNQSFHFCEQ